MRLLLSALACLSLVACEADPTRPDFFGEAGRAADDDGFGRATMNNVLIQSGQTTYAMSLSRRFREEVPTTITFAFDSAALDAEARRVLDRQAAWIRQFPEVRFAVFGHTDLVGSAAYNHRLGLRRAQAAVDYLVSRGVDRGRLEALVSRGQTEPVVLTAGPERRNRRTVTEVRGFVQSHPNVLNGKYAEIVFREYVASAVPPQVPIVTSQPVAQPGQGQ
ncbi:OmpA family protein [Rubellimicrobium sp. CFH 75288]|uniref:OmpA family protein n=1 Tax=Rubellimicrobium sp. CFH 75288 TaxID=2697034 RepID=UPI0014127067|nr:OmpA family protein [Rubellimicrobium sp. CFH 75288]NAZ35623.1 OmpA family protein [Rubellimicrobium sp. CFH 75288]